MNKINKNPESKLSNSLGLGVYDQIRQAIGSNQFKPGDRITENSLATWLNVSRTPIREAVFRLESDGLLIRGPRGLIVRKLTYQEIVELYAMREVLEGTAARLAAIHASSAEVTTLDEIIESEIHANKTNAPNSAKLNKHFHSVVHHAAHNRYLIESLKGISDAMILLENTTLSIPGRYAEAINEHKKIVRAIENKKPDIAESAARKHIEKAKAYRLKMVLDEMSESEI